MLRSVLAFTLVVLSVGAACAQDPPRRVGRLSYIEGIVSFHWSNQADWAPATVNYPVTSGESLWTEPSARAEIQIGPSELRLDEATELDVLRLDDRTIELRLDQGTLNLHLWQMPRGGMSVLTPRGRVVLTMLGSYDIDAGRPDGGVPADRVRVTVLEGAARFDGERGAVEIGHSEAAVISGEPMNVTLAAATYSPFDDWALARERREVAAQQPGYVAPSVTGYQDLNEYGSWSHDPNYGGVWYPAAVPEGWAPYRYGHWAFVPPWGWTWIDDAPWGFAPFHYGRWIEIGDRWGWVPGALVERPVYAPALVAFIGGDGWGINLEVGPAVAAVGWVALAPDEIYHPYYRASQTYIRNINITNVNRAAINHITINNNARVSNFHNQRAATVVPEAAFTRAAAVQRATVALPEAQLAQASVAPSIAHLRPGAAARIGREDPAAAASSVPQPNAPATIARTRVASTPAPAPSAEQAPTAPGPHRNSGERREATSPPAAAAPVQPQRQSIQTKPAPIASAGGEVSAPSAQPAPHPTPPGEAVQRSPSPTAASSAQPPQHPTAAARQVATAPPPPRTAGVPSRPQPQVQPSHPAPPAIQVAHPAQQTHIAPTPQAWTRVPGPPPQPKLAQPARAPAPNAAAIPHAAQPPQPSHAASPSVKPPPPKEPPAKGDHLEQH
jgi:hypothetical protein